MPRRYRRAPLLPALRPVIQDLEGRTLLAAGLNASYYNDINLSGTPVTRVDNGVNFAFSSTVAPAAGINPQLFSARWTGQVTPKYTQAYTFTTRSDDGVRLWVNGQQLVNNWNRHAPTNNSGVINLVAGQSYDVRMEYFNQWGNGVAQLSWASASQASQIIPSTSLSTDGTTTPPPVTPPPPPGNGDGLFGAYYGDMTFGVKKFQRIDPTVNFNWGAGSPNAAIPTDNFSVRWTGQILAQKSETYTFYTTSDDGARLTINGVRVIDKLIPQGPTEWSGSIALVAGQKYNIALEYFDRSGGASAVLRYSSPTTAKQVVPQAVLFSSQSTTPPPVQAPAAPTGVSAAAINTTQIQLSWTDLPTENGYKIERSANGTTGWTQIATPSAGSTGYLNTGLAPNTTYYYRLRGFNAGGDGAYSAVFSAKTQAITPPAAPTFTGIRPVPVTALEIKWTNVAGETGYKLERSLSPTSGFTQIATTGADLTTYVDDSNLPGNTLFYYRVRAYNGGGDSDYSPASGGTTNSGNPGPPATLPTNFAAQALSTTEIKLTWSDSTYESVYEIERSPNGTTGWTQIGGADANILTYTDTFLTPNTTYFYRIRAGNSGGFTPYTAVVSAKTLSAPAGASQPDVQVQVRKETTFAGDNVYNTTGVNQVRAATGEFFPTIFHVRVYNDGATADSFVVTAPTGDADYRLAYYDSTTTGWNGGVTIGAAVTGAGWNTGVIQPGAFREFRVEVLPQAALGGTSGAWNVMAKSATDASKVDVVRVQVNTPVVRSVLFKRRNFDASGSYLIEVQNRGNVPDAINLTVGLNNANFQVQFFDDHWAGNNVTTALRSAAGWTTRVLQPFETQQVRVVFSGYANPAAPDINLVAASVDNPAAKEILPVKIGAAQALPVDTDFFPIGAWGQYIGTFDTWKSRGVNTMVEYQGNLATIEEWSQLARDKGLHYIRTTPLDAHNDIGDPWLLAWSLPDEPELPPNAPRQTAQQMAAKVAALKAIDPTRPIWQNFAGGFVVQWQGTQIPKGTYVPYLNNLDWVSSSVYPVTGYNRTTVNQGLDIPGVSIDTLEKWSNGKPQWGFIEMADQELAWIQKEAGVVAPDQYRAELWDTIIRGAKGITYFPQSFSPTFKFDNTTPAVAAEMVKQHALIQSIAGALLSDTDPPTRGFDAAAGSIQGSWRVYDGKTYYVLLNMSDQSVTTQVALHGLPSNAAPVAVVGESRSVTLSPTGTFTDTFAPLSVHIYQIG